MGGRTQLFYILRDSAGGSTPRLLYWIKAILGDTIKPGNLRHCVATNLS